MFLFFKNTFYVHNSNGCRKAPGATRARGLAMALRPTPQSGPNARGALAKG